MSTITLLDGQFLLIIFSLSESFSFPIVLLEVFILLEVLILYDPRDPKCLFFVILFLMFWIAQTHSCYDA